jgi:hypothetical protein
MANPLVMSGGLFQQGNLPWWLTYTGGQNPETGYIEYKFFDKNTGQPVTQDPSGNFSYQDGSTPSYGAPANASVIGAGSPGLTQLRLADGTTANATLLTGDTGDYSQLFQGLVPGQGIAQVPGQGASPSQVVRGSDGQLYSVLQPGSQITRSRPDNTGFGSLFAKDFMPIVTAAMGGAGLSGGGLASAFGGGATGAAAAGATMGGANALLTGGDVLGGALKGGALGGAGYGIGNAMSGTGFPAPVQAGATNFLTSMLGGQSPTQAAVGGAIAGANRAFASPSYDAATDAALGGGMGGRESLSSNNLVPSSSAPLPTVPATTGGKMADDMYGGFGYDDTNAATDAALGGGMGGAESLPSTGAAGGAAIPSWLRDFFATQGVPGALISGAGGLLAANMTGNAARDAAARSGQASEAATALQAQQYADARARSQPFYNAGVNALAQYQNPELTRPFAMSDFNADPGYGFRMDQGMKALNQSMAAKGLGVSGTGIKGAMNFGQNLGSQEYQNAYARYGQDQATRRNTLANIAGFGPPAAAATTAAGTNYATNAGNMGMGAANTFANADMAAAAAQASAYGGIGNALGRAFSPDPMTAAITQMMQKQYGVG